MQFTIYFSLLYTLLCGFIGNIGCVQCYNGYCYMIFNETAKYADVLTQCTNGYIVLEIHSSQMQSDIEIVLAGYELSEFQFYIGLTDYTEGSFTWNSGTTFSYTNFSPVNSNTNGKDCVFISSNDSWQWFSTPCNSNKNCICFKEGTGTEVETTTSTSTSTLAETPSTAPEKTSDVSETTSTAPETTSDVSETTSTAPETTSTVSETTSDVSETTSTAPEATSTAPETTSTVSETTYTAPETTPSAPETTPSAPETTSTVSETTSSAPETTSTETETTSTAPETTSTLPKTLTSSLQSVNTPTTSIQTNISSIHLRCAFKTITCRCGQTSIPSISEELQTLYSELSNISKSAKQFKKSQQLYSRQDYRTSSQTLGYLGAGILVALTIVVLIFDLSRICNSKIHPVVI